MMRRAGGVAFFFILVFISSCVKPPQPVSETAGLRGSENAQLSEEAEEQLAETIMMASPYLFTFERDPFKSVTGGAWSEPSSSGALTASGEDLLFLHGIISFGGIPYAVIQIQGKTKPYKVKEMVGPYLLESIESRRVLLRREQDQLELKVGGS